MPPGRYLLSIASVSAVVPMRRELKVSSLKEAIVCPGVSAVVPMRRELKVADAVAAAHSYTEFQQLSR